MCILFMHKGDCDDDSDYCLVLASNREEFYDRPTQNLASWSEDPNVIGGRDLEEGRGHGTWLAISPLRKKIGVLLNLTGSKILNAKSRGKIVTDFVKSDKSTSEYIESLNEYVKECNNFVFVTVEFANSEPTIQVYNNATEKLDTLTDSCVGFSNSLPETPLKKVEAGKNQMESIINKLNKVSSKENLVEELIRLLRSKECHLPDPELQRRNPNSYKELSSIFVCVPEGRYGTRTHTIVLITKTGHADIIELTMQPPIDALDPKWHRTELQVEMKLGR